MPQAAPPIGLDAVALIRRLLLPAAISSLLLAGILAVPPRTGLAIELHRSGIPAVPLAAIMLVLVALLGTAQLTRARGGTWPTARATQWSQLLVVTPLAWAAAAMAWLFHPAASSPAVLPQTGFVLAGCAAAVAFGLLIAERAVALTPARVLPEASGLRALLFAALAATFAMAGLEVAAQLGFAIAAARAGTIVALAIAAIGIELGARAALGLYLPPSSPASDRAAVQSAIAQLLSSGLVARDGMAAPARKHLGIDFSRSWALAYVRPALPPMAVFLGLLAWGLTGVTLVPLDGRAVYERFGAPVRVLHPGLHLGLPWPFGTARAVEFGPVHAIGLLPRSPQQGATIPAEDPAPQTADRLWDGAHPGELTLLIASDTGANEADTDSGGGRQNFQSVSADLRVLYRTGLTDAAALQAAYAAVAPEDLARATAGRVVAAYFAARTLDAVLGGNRDTMAATMRDRLQSALDAHGAGLDIIDIVIEAIHPPAGAAYAWHNVRAAEIAARTSVAVEHGAAATIYAQSRQYAHGLTTGAQAKAAETIAGADAGLIRFDADIQAAKAGGEAFLLERYFTALSGALAKAPKTIIDHRLNWPEAPVLDLRPFSAAAGAGTGKEE